MNIFVLDRDPKKCAEYHCNKHVIKQILESAQMLSTVCNAHGVETQYKPTHKNHPCTLWVGESLCNWLWLKWLTAYLNEEYRYRFDKDVSHKSAVVAKKLMPPDLPVRSMTPFAQAMPDQYKSDDPIEAYRKYYIGEKAHFCTWTKRDVPRWFDEKK